MLEQQEIKIANMEKENTTKAEAVSLRLKEHYLSEITGVEEKLKNEMASKHANEVANLKIEWETKRNNLSNDYEQKLLDMIEQKKIMEEKMKSQLSDSKASFLKRIEDLEMEIETLRKGLDHQKEELESQCEKKMQSALDSLAVSAKQDHEKHISSIVKEFEEKESQLTDRYETRMSTEISRVVGRA